MANTSLRKAAAALLALAAAVGCEGIDDMEHQTVSIASLMHDADAGAVGARFINLPPAAVPAVGIPGLGKLTTLVKFQPVTAKQANPLKLAKTPMMLTASVFATGIAGPPGPASGPLYGVARWGAGNGQQQEIEFDLGFNFPGSTTPAPAGSIQPAGGVVFSVPGTSLEVLARNDANFIPFNMAIALGLGTNTLPQATASIAEGRRSGSTQLKNTQYAIWSPGAPKVAGLYTIPVPAWAKSYRIFRSGGAGGGLLTVGVTDVAFVTVDSYTIAAGAVAPEVSVFGNAGAINVTTAATLETLGAVFTLGI